MCNLSGWVLEQGIEQGIEKTAIKLIHLKNYTDEEIHNITELSLEQIRKLRERELCKA